MLSFKQFHSFNRFLFAITVSTCLLFAGCGTPLGQLAVDVQKYPKTLLIGNWNGRFEVSDASGVYDLKYSDAYVDQQTLRSIQTMQNSKHFYSFKKGGKVQFYDPRANRFIDGTWEINKVEGRTVMLDIRSKFANFRKPATFAGYNTVIFRSGVNPPKYQEYGKVVYYREKNWE
ncbi:MAG: hypothetical protein ACI9G1_000096 [Pirellulaceae bacterium]|jgi:hypothetical protein